MLFPDLAERVVMRRAWCMPSPDTFTMPPVAELLDRWIVGASVIVDPFARNGRRGTLRNDLNPETAAEYHMDAAEFGAMLVRDGVRADVVLFDPPYSPRQISEVYAQIGRAATREDTQNASLYRRVRDPLAAVLREGGVALSFGWNSSGFGKARGFEAVEILMCCHGGAHNDTICVVERKVR